MMKFSKKLFSVIFGEVLIMTALYWMLTISPEVFTGKLAVITMSGIIGLPLLYGFQNVINNFIKSKWFSEERFKSEKK